MKLVSYNVNGIRAAMRKGLLEWLMKKSPDVFCVQETKAHSTDVDLFPFRELGYQVGWHQAEKKGYSGVAIFSKRKPRHIELGMGMEKYDREGRVIRMDFEEFSLINVYMPSGTTGSERQNFKYEWLDDFQSYIDNLKKTLPNLVICGDFNIANHPIDIHNPVSNKNSSGFLPEERDWLTKFYESGFIDAFRSLNPEPHHYTWWTYRANARANNKGWRIDYFALSENLKPKLKSASIANEAIHSDHCPVIIEVDLN